MTTENQFILNRSTQQLTEYTTQVEQHCQQMQQVFSRFQHWLNRLVYEQHVRWQNRSNQIEKLYPFVLTYQKPGQYMVHLGDSSMYPDVQNPRLLQSTYRRQEEVMYQIYCQNQMGYVVRVPPPPLKVNVKTEYVTTNDNKSLAQSNSVKSRAELELKALESQSERKKRGRKKTALQMPDEFQKIQGTINSIIQIPQTSFLDKNRIIKRRIRKDKDQKRQQLIQGKDLKETKNIPKNYVKATITYVLKHPSVVKKIIPNQEAQEQFLIFLAKTKMIISNIKQLCNILISDSEDPRQREFNRAFRILFNTFLKKNAIAYVFNSRITQVNWHLMYRYNLQRAILQPENFKKVREI